MVLWEIFPASEGPIVPNSYNRSEINVFVPPRYDQTSGDDATPENRLSPNRCFFPENRVLEDRGAFNHASGADRIKPG